MLVWELRVDDGVVVRVGIDVDVGVGVGVRVCVDVGVSVGVYVGVSEGLCVNEGVGVGVEAWFLAWRPSGGGIVGCLAVRPSTWLCPQLAPSVLGRSCGEARP